MVKNLINISPTFQEATRFIMFLFKKVPLKRPLAEECYEHRWLTQSDFMNKKRERARFLGNRLKVNRCSSAFKVFWSFLYVEA